ncbi:MAG: type I glyceraldehyde-3-phosphate dehydrogenase [Holosporaceae bacterium]|jgi:glyceraldehyde 3-phosphate dehydrogenase|nr:type I glyceraldehyde-3-phosphate dehydrogenase [Holosporaceae bacterium]
MRVAINGFGRIGRLILRAFLERNSVGLDVVAINDLQSLDSALHLLKYDSTHGRFLGEVEKKSDNVFCANKMELAYFSEKCPDRLPWRDMRIDLVLECTGAFKSREQCIAHLKAGAKYVLVSRPVDDADNTIVYGVNHDSLGCERDLIISNASCTTNCLAHVVAAILEYVKIERGFATTVHSYTGDQRLVDMNHTDLRRARAAASCMAPTSTGATKAIEKIFPELRGRLSGLSIRVPTQNVSLLDFTFTTAEKITIEDINAAIVRRSAVVSKEVFSYTKDPLVSVDFNHSSCSAVVDLPLTKVVDGHMGHVVAWYDNEWGFARRMLDTTDVLKTCLS